MVSTREQDSPTSVKVIVPSYQRHDCFDISAVMDRSIILRQQFPFQGQIHLVSIFMWPPQNKSHIKFHASVAVKFNEWPFGFVPWCPVLTRSYKSDLFICFIFGEFNSFSLVIFCWVEKLISFYFGPERGFIKCLLLWGKFVYGAFLFGFLRFLKGS